MSGVIFPELLERYEVREAALHEKIANPTQADEYSIITQSRLNLDVRTDDPAFLCDFSLEVEINNIPRLRCNRCNSTKYFGNFPQWLIQIVILCQNRLKFTKPRTVTALELTRLALGEPTWVKCGVCCGEHKIVGAVKFEHRGERNCRGRTRISEFPRYNTKTLRSLVEREVANGSVVKTDEIPSYTNLPETDHDKQVVGKLVAHDVIPETSVYHGLRAKHLQSYLDEFVVHFNRRVHPSAGLESQLNMVMKSRPMTYKMVIASEQRAQAFSLDLRKPLNVQS